MRKRQPRQNPQPFIRPITQPITPQPPLRQQQLQQQRLRRLQPLQQQHIVPQSIVLQVGCHSSSSYIGLVGQQEIFILFFFI